MKFVVDTHLPRQVCGWLATVGCSGVHVPALPGGDRTADNWITAYADGDGRVVVTKDRDFAQTHVLYGRPRKLLLVTTGNISTAELKALLVPLLPEVVAGLATNDFVELCRTGLRVRG